MKLAYCGWFDGFNTWFSLSKVISLVNIRDNLKYFLFNLFLIIEQTFVFSTVEVKPPLFLFSSSHSHKN